MQPTQKVPFSGSSKTVSSPAARLQGVDTDLIMEADESIRRAVPQPLRAANFWHCNRHDEACDVNKLVLRLHARRMLYTVSEVS